MTTPLLEGKVAIITGASRGIGAAASRAFAAEGAAVVLAARSASAIEVVAAEITAAGGKALAWPTDVTDAASVERLVAHTLSTYGRLDVAFNNAGAGNLPRPLADISVEEFEAAIRTNLLGVFISMKYEIPAMLAGGGGAIVNMSSTAGLQGAPGMGPYSAGKHGVIGLTKTAALDYGRQNVRVNAVAPGPIVNEHMATLPAETLNRIAMGVPMGKLGQLDEVAMTALWLCSDYASYIHGSVISIDGGRLAGAPAPPSRPQ